jgi:tetratricopeptide (TPR) repeat protein
MFSEIVSRRAALALPALFVIFAGGCSRDPHAAMLKFAKNGDALAAKGKTAEAIIEYRNALEKEPTAGDVRIKLAEAYLKTGEGAKAVQEYARAADLVPDPQVQIKSGNLLLLARRFDDAKARAEKALAADSKNVEAQILLANSLAGMKDLDGAVTQLEEAIRLNPDRSATYTNLGEIELGRGRRDAAEQAFRHAVELAPTSAVARLSLANFYSMTGQLPAAEEQLKEALKAEPDNALVHRITATFYLASNRRDEAEPHLRRVVELTKSTTAALMLADYYVAQRREAEARKTLEPLSTSAESAAEADVRLAILDRAAGHPDEASKRLDRVLSGNAKDLQALLLRSSFLLSDNKLDEALKVATSAVDAHPESVSGFYMVGRVQAARHQTAAAIAAYQQVLRLNPLAADAKVALARLQLAAGQTDSSVAMAEEALKTQPENGDARLALVQGLIRRGDLQRAEADLNALKAKFPGSPAVHTQAGMLLGLKGRSQEARAEFDRALQLEPNSIEAIGGLVALDVSARKIPEARARVDALIASPTAKPVALMLAARTYAAAGDLATAEKTLRRVLTVDPAYLSAYAALGQLYARQGRLDAALTEFEALAERDPKPVAPLTLVGMILDSQGNTAAAQKKFERVMQLDAEAPVAANNLAWIYAENGGNLDVALQLAQTAKRKLPELAEVNDTLGYIYYKKNLPALALPPLRASVEKDPANAGFHYHLGLAYAQAGESALARQSLTKALSLKLDEKGAQDARAVLDSLKGGE